MACPEHLLDAEKLARQLWDYWVSLMNTDQVEGVEEVPVWDENEDDVKDCFLEAVEYQITKPLQKYEDDREFESSLDEAFTDVRPTPPQYEPEEKQRACYICARNPVRDAGGICSICRHSHVKWTSDWRNDRHGR